MYLIDQYRGCLNRYYYVEHEPDRTELLKIITYYKNNNYKIN